MGRSLTPGHFAVLEQWSKGRYWSGTRRSPHHCSHRLIGFSVGLSVGLSSCATMSHWWLYLSLCLHGTNTWWGCCIIYPTCHSFMFTVSSVCGKANPLADSLSCFQFQHFHHRSRQAHLTPHMIPELLLVALPKTWPWGVSFCSTKDSCLPLGMFISSQRHYIDFCRWDGYLNRDGSFPPANEETLMCFATLLANNLTHASI